MKSFYIIVLLCRLTCPASAQGTILFSNFVPGEADSRFFNWGVPIGPQWKAQLFTRSTDEGEFLPLFPITRFTTDTEEFGTGYAEPIVVAVPGQPPGSQLSVVMRAFLGETIETTHMTCIAESSQATVTLGGDGLPPGVLRGLGGPSELACIPEPSTWGLLVFGFVGLLLWNRKLPWGSSLNS